MTAATSQAEASTHMEGNPVNQELTTSAVSSIAAD